MKKLIIAAVILVGSITYAKTNLTTGNESFSYTNQQMHFQLNIPVEWKDKMLTQETDNSVSFRYSNPGGKPVFLFSINKVDEKIWQQVKQNIANAVVLSEENGMVYYSEKTEAGTIKGKNNEEYKSILPHLDEVIKTFKEI